MPPQFLTSAYEGEADVAVALDKTGRLADFGFVSMGILVLPVTIPLKAGGLLADLKQSFADSRWCSIYQDDNSQGASPRKLEEA